MKFYTNNSIEYIYEEI